MPELRHVLPAIVIALSAQVATAQTTPTPPTSASMAAPAVVAAPAPIPACELHIWPAARVSAVTQGAGSAFGLIGALVDAAAHADQNKRDTAFITGALDAKAQARLLRAMDLPTLLHLPPSQVIVHDEGIDIKEDDPKRLSNSTAVCYSEFVVRGLMYFKNVAYSGQMRTFLEVRKFDGAALKIDFRDSKHENLEVKLPKEGEDTGPATDALLSALRGDVAFFADKFVRKNK